MASWPMTLEPRTGEPRFRELPAQQRGSFSMGLNARGRHWVPLAFVPAPFRTGARTRPIVQAGVQER